MTADTLANLYNAIALVVAGLIFIALLFAVADDDSVTARFFKALSRKTHSPHSYSTGLCHTRNSGQSCNPARRDCAICEEGR